MQTSTSEQPLGTIKDTFSSGMNFLRRRFSSTDLGDELPPQAQQQPPPPPPASGYAATAAVAPSSANTTPAGSSTNPFSLSGFTSRVASTISAPTSPAKSTTPQSMYSQMQGLTRNLFQAASNQTNSGGPQQQPIVYTNADKCKCILVIDDQLTDWSKYFRGKKVLNEYDIRVEQGEFSELTISAYSDAGCVVDINANRPSGKIVRSFRPDFALIRQHVKTDTHDYSNLIVALMFGAVPTLNTLHSIYNFLQKPWVFSYLLAIERRLGKDKFPLIDQAYYPVCKEISSTSSQFPVVIKVGHGQQGVGTIKVNDSVQLIDVANLANGQPATVEPFIDSKYDVHVHKIGLSYKAFIRKGISNHWKTNFGSSMLEQVALTERYKLWVDHVSQLFGGLDICSVDALVGKDGRETIYEVNDCTMLLLGESQEEDRRLIAELALVRLSQICNRTIDTAAPKNLIKHESPTYQPVDNRPNQPPPPQRPVEQQRPMVPAPSKQPVGYPPPAPPQRGVPPPRPARQPSVGNDNREVAKPSPPPPPPPTNNGTAAPTQQQDDTMGQLKRTFAGIFGDM